MNDGIRHLLEYATKQSAIGREATSAELHSIAEVIDCEMRSLKDERDHWMELAHQWEAGASTSGFAERLEAASSERADVTLFGVEYTALPVDAEGEAIHVGDVMEWCQGGNVFTVTALHLVSSELEVWGDDADYAPDECRHHHAPTVEDILREMLFKAHIYDRREMELLPDLIAEYAARLRLAEGVDE